MPTLPRYDSSQNINTQPAGVERNIASEPFKAMQGMLDTDTKITQGLSDANDVMQETKAKTQMEVALAQQEQAAQNDPNPDNAEFHVKAINDLTKNATKGIDNQEVAGKVGLEIQQSAFLSQIKIQDLFKKKQVFANDLSLDALATTAAANKATAVSTAAGQQDEDNFMATISKNVNTGLITPERGMALVKQYKVGVVKNKIMNTPSENFGDYKGMTDGLDLKESDDANKLIQSHIKQLEETRKQNWYQNEAQITQGIANNNYPNEQTLDKAIKLGQIPPEFAKTVLETIHSPAMIAAQTDDNEFSNLTKQAFKGDKEDVRKTLVNILKGGKSGSLSKDDMGVLVASAMLQGQSQRDDIKNAIESLGNDTDKAGLNRASVFREFQKNIHSGKNVAESAKAALQKNIVDTVPGASVLSNPPNAVISDKEATRYLIKPTTDKTNTQYIYDPKNKSVIPNPDYKRPRPNASGSSGQNNG